MEERRTARAVPPERRPDPTDLVGSASRGLTFAAAVSALRDSGRESRFDPFIPFIAEVIRESGADAMTLPELQGLIEDHTELRIPQGALHTMVRRAASHWHFVERRNGKVVVRRDRLDRFTMRPLQERFLRDHQAVVAGIQRFAADRHDVTVDADLVEEALLNFVEERAALLALRHPMGSHRATGPVGDVDLEYLIAAYLDHVRDHDPVAFAYVETVVQGVMWQTYLFVPDLGSVQRKFRDSTLLLDTKLLMQGLGWEGPELQDAVLELLDLARTCGARLAAFDITVDEVRRVLRAVAHALRAPGRSGDAPDASSRVEEHFLDQGIAPSRVETYAETLDDRLGELGVGIVVADRRRTADRDDDRAALAAELGEYRHRRARDVDVEVLLQIDEARGAASPRVLEECRALFVTANQRHVDAARDHFDEDPENGRWPLAIREHDLATLLWLKRPLEAPDLPRKRLLADCYAAMRPTEELWERFLDTLDRLRASGDLREDDYHRLRHVQGVRETLMDATRGDPDRMTVGTVETLLDVARRPRHDHQDVGMLVQNLAREFADQLDAGAERLRAEFGEMLENRLAEMVAVEVRERLDARSRERRRRRVVRAVRTFLVALVLVVLAIPVGTLLVAPSALWAVVTIEVGVFGIVSFACGWPSIPSAGRRLERRLLGETGEEDAHADG